MSTKLTKLTAIALTAALLATAAGPAMAAITFDNETTNSSTTSDLVGGETVTDLDNETVYERIQVVSDNASTSALTAPEDAFKLKVTVNDTDSAEDGRTVYTNSSTTKIVNASAGHYAYNISHAELFDELERDIDETVSVDVTVTFNESESDEESATIKIHAQNGDDKAVEVISDRDVDSSNGTDAEVVNESKWIGDDHEFATLDTEKSISNNTTVVFVLANDSIADRYTSAYDVASFSSGDYLYSMTTRVEGKPIMIFDRSKGDERDAGFFTGGFDDDEDTYATYENNGGAHGTNPQLAIVPQGDHADKKSLEVESTGYKQLGLYANLKNFGGDAARSAGFGEVPEEE